MAAYCGGGKMVVKFSAGGNLRKWTAAKIVARHFTATAGTEKADVYPANAEFAQLATGRIILACNLRPSGWRHDVHPCAIAIVTSDDAGGTWSPLKVVYAPKPAVAADGRPHGCYEPFVLPLKGGRAQMYFADETPYAEAAKCAWQNISFVETADGGETWGKAKVAAYTPKRRDGMPVVMDFGKWRYLALEANPRKTRLHPQIVKCSVASGKWEKAKRFDPLAEPPDWNKAYGGAPYIVHTENYILLSWQTGSLPDSSEKTSVARVAAVPKSELAADGSFTTMRGVSTPPDFKPGKERMLWNSLCPVGGDSFLLVSEVNGKILAYPGKIRAIRPL